MINLYDIQPGEDLIKKETLRYFVSNPHEIFNKKPPIRVVEISGHCFKYYALNGNNRLLACHKLGITEIPIEPDLNESYMELWEDLAKEIYSEGIKNWSSLKKRIFPRKRWERISNRRTEEAIDFAKSNKIYK